MELQYKQLIDSISDWLWEINSDNNYTYCSDSVSKFLGFKATELIGKTPFDFMSDEEAQKLNKCFTLHTINKKSIVEFENIYIHKNGQEVTVTINAIPILNENGDVTSFQCISKDITLKKKKQREIKILEERLSLALAGSNDGVWDWNIVDNSVYFSPRWKEIIGYSDKELTNEVQNWTDRIHPDDLEATWGSINKHINSDTEYYKGVHRLKHKDGHWIWIFDRGKALYDSSGKAIRMIGTHTDITEQKAVELKALHQKQIIEQVHDSVISTDLKGVITGWNRGSEVLFGYSFKEAVGKCITLIYLKEDLKNITKDIRSLINKGSDHATRSLLSKSKEILAVDISLSLLKDEKNNPMGMVGYLKDITETKKAEEALAQQSRMVQMGEMISMIAHQWRQPLNAISLTASNLKLKFDFDEFNSNSEEDFNQCSQDFSQGLDNIEEYIQTLSSTIDDFRNFYKTDKEAVSTKLENIVEKSLKIIGMSLAHDKIKTILEYNSNEEIELYENEMLQVILTIFKNAQDHFIEEKTENPVIKVVTTGRMISICDNGGGVPKNILKKIFNPYFSTKLEENGSGLGLYMSKTIVEDHHNAKLKVKNIDDGACFTIEF